MCFSSPKAAPAAPIDYSPKIYDSPDMQGQTPQAVSKLYARDFVVDPNQQTKPQNPNALKTNGLQIM